MEQIIRKDVELEHIEKEIIALKNQTAQNIIQIGYKLIEAKEKLQHGEWGDWLRERIDFSQRTANQFMRIAKEFGTNPQMIINLDTTKIYLLMELPVEDRDSFIKGHNLQAMSTREMKKAVNKLKNMKKTPQQQIERFNERIIEIDRNIEKLVKEKNQIADKLKTVYEALNIGCPEKYKTDIHSTM